jgi:hypothetical protein
MSALSGIAAHAPSVRPRSVRATNLLLAVLLAGLGLAAYLAVGATTKTAQATPRTASTRPE